MKRLWLVRLGGNGEYDSDALDHSLLSIGFNITTNLSSAKDRDTILEVIKTVFPDAKTGRQRNFAAQVNQFVNTMAVDDIVISPLKTLSKIGIGKITGPYHSSLKTDAQRALSNGSPQMFRAMPSNRTFSTASARL